MICDISMFSVFGINVCNRRLTVVSNYTSGRICYNSERGNDIMGSKRNLKRTLSLVTVLVMLSLVTTIGNASAGANDHMDGDGPKIYSVVNKENGHGLRMRVEAILPEDMGDYLKFFGKKQRNK